MASLVCPLCGRDLDIRVYSGKCGDCEKLISSLFENGTFAIPEELKDLIHSPTWLLPDDGIELAVIRAGRITERDNYRQDIDIAIAVAKKPNSAKEGEFVAKILPHYRREAESRNAQMTAFADKQKQLAKIIASRAQ